MSASIHELQSMELDAFFSSDSWCNGVTDTGENL
jgi:hypothetical protein